MKRITVPLFLLTLICLVTPLAALAVTIPTVPVGNPGNANNPLTGNLYGGVAYSYRIGTTEVTNAQYVEFLNAKDAGGTNALFLYNTNMSHDKYGGISFSAGNANGSKYSVISGRGNQPASWITWYDAIRFANWMNNGQGTSSTETGAYTLGTLGAGGVPNTPPLTHNAGSQVWLPTENEWYKAAYYDARTTVQGGPLSDSHYWLYPTSSTSPAPTASGPTALANHANFDTVVGNLTDVGAYTGTTSPYGAFDMGGNVMEWNESALISSQGVSLRGVRGGAFYSPAVSFQSSHRLNHDNPTAENNNGVGFRLATVPEPSTAVLAVMACGMMWCWRKRFK